MYFNDNKNVHVKVILLDWKLFLQYSMWEMAKVFLNFIKNFLPF